MEPQRLANRVFWSTFGLCICAPTAIVLASFPPNKGDSGPTYFVAMITILALMLPAGCLGALLSSPVRRHGAEGAARTIGLAVVAVACAVLAWLWWRAHPMKDVDWPLTRAAWRAWGPGSLVLFPIYIFTFIVDAVVMVAVGIVSVMAPGLLPALGALAGVLVAMLVLSIVARLARFAQGTSS